MDRDAPDWDDEFVDRVGDRLFTSYDLTKNARVDGERFTLRAELRMERYKQFFHPALSYGHHESAEHLFVRRVDRTSVAELERLVAFGHDLADRWIEPSEEHFSTEFTFALVVETAKIDPAVREFVADFRDRTLLKRGYYGHYEINLVVVAPEVEELSASTNADIADAFRFWEPDDAEREGVIGRLADRLPGR
ncbi:hypothetical protein BRD12_06000 [Halobacteriales archaeon SW_12_67_38]|nr:MAG: hypothetical protein BRD12_06000 [Halobacteriales archaeon SW_12_67_38]